VNIAPYILHKSSNCHQESLILQPISRHKHQPDKTIQNPHPYSPTPKPFKSPSHTTPPPLQSNKAMSNPAGAPLVTDANASLSKERIAELNEQYRARIAAEKAEKEAVKKAKKGKDDKKNRKASSTGGG